MPVIMAAAGLETINNMFEEGFFTSLSDFIKYILSLCLKIMGIAFTFIISFQRLGTSGASSFAVKAAKNAAKVLMLLYGALATYLRADFPFTDKIFPRSAVFRYRGGAGEHCGSLPTADSFRGVVCGSVQPVK